MDWWSFGILIYELLYGFTPFRGKKRDETFNNILKRPLNFPEQPEVSEACKVRRGIRLHLNHRSSLRTCSQTTSSDKQLNVMHTTPHTADQELLRLAARKPCDSGRAHP